MKDRSPMKRGLKDCCSPQSATSYPSERPIPDEEGTERVDQDQGPAAMVSERPIPDEEGTERVPLASSACEVSSERPIPDEEGTESLLTSWSASCSVKVKDRSPMKRGLKATNGFCHAPGVLG